MPKPRPSRSGKHRRRPVVVGEGRETQLDRQTNKFQQRLTVLAATNGKVTEYQYLRALKKEFALEDSCNLQVKFVSGSPIDVLNRVGQLAAAEDYDHMFVVCDVDEYNVARTAEHVKDLAAKGAYIEVLWSNPCFEVWLI